jgi:hypothetical protein
MITMGTDIGVRIGTECYQDMIEWSWRYLENMLVLGN